MYRLTQPNRNQIQSGSISSIFPNTFNHDNQKVSQIKAVIADTSEVIESMIPRNNVMVQEDSFTQLKPEFEQLLRDKLTKIDDILVNLKERFDKSDNVKPKYDNYEEVKMNEPVTNKVLEKSRSKRTYYKITDTMWNEVKNRFTEIPEEYKSKTYSDGVDYYIEHKNKKIILDGKALLKVLNNK